MKKRKRLYNRARSVNSEDAWSQYRTIKNQINKEIDKAHKNYQEKLFDNNSSSSHKNFWRYVKSLCKDKSGVPPLNFNETTVHNTKDKAEILNNQFMQPLFVKIYEVYHHNKNSPYPAIPDTSFSVDGILQLLNSIDINKACGPDNIPARVLKLCGPEIV